jgi:hypothetical protein
MLFIAALTAVLIQDSFAMLRWFYVLAHLLVEAGAARRGARIRFLKAQVELPLPEARTAGQPNNNYRESQGMAWSASLRRWARLTGQIIKPGAIFSIG